MKLGLSDNTQAVSHKVEGKSSELPFIWAAVSDVGKVRKENEDAYFIEPEVGLFLVSDGMGGSRR